MALSIKPVPFHNWFKRSEAWCGFLALLLIALYAPVLASLARAWWSDQYAGHGIFVPAFSAVLVWHDRERVRASIGRPNGIGIILILVALAILIVGRSWGSLSVQTVSVVVAIAGLLLLVGGGRCLRAMAFPVAFLVFMAPLPELFVESVTLHLQLFAAQVAGAVLDVLEVPFNLNGLDIVLPALTLRVAEVCNGLRFLMALLVLTTAFAYVSQPSVPRMVLLIASAIPIAILANAFRVTAIAVAVQYVGPQAASGAIHHAIGKGVWALTFVPLVVMGLVLRGGVRVEWRPRARATAARRG